MSLFAHVINIQFLLMKLIGPFNLITYFFSSFQCANRNARSVSSSAGQASVFRSFTLVMVNLTALTIAMRILRTASTEVRGVI